MVNREKCAMSLGTGQGKTSIMMLMAFYFRDEQRNVFILTHQYMLAHQIKKEIKKISVEVSDKIKVYCYSQFFDFADCYAKLSDHNNVFILDEYDEIFNEKLGIQTSSHIYRFDSFS